MPMQASGAHGKMTLLFVGRVFLTLLCPAVRLIF